MKYILTIIFNLFIGLSAFATAQFPDKIIYNGKEYKLHTNPMEEYFQKYPEKRPKKASISTALWRGYVATFEVRNGQVYLKDIQIEVYDTTSLNYIWQSVLKDVFPEQKEIKIDWLTGILVIPHGKMVNYVHMGYGSTYKKYILLEIDKGDLKKEKRFNHKVYSKFKERQFEAFRQTEEYKKLKEELKKDGSSDEMIDNFLKSYVVQYSSKILVD